MSYESSHFKEKVFYKMKNLHCLSAILIRERRVWL